MFIVGGGVATEIYSQFWQTKRSVGTTVNICQLIAVRWSALLLIDFYYALNFKKQNLCESCYLS